MEEGLSGFYIKTAGVRSACGGGGGVVGHNGAGTGAKCGRWNPTTEQVKVLTELFRSGLRTPSTDQIQKISTQLSLYGKIESKNVFYWFQNHKARERQKRRKVSTISDQKDFLRHDDKILSPNHFSEIKQVFEPERVMETLQLFPINAMEEADSNHYKLRSSVHAKQYKETTSFTYTFETEMGTHPPLDLRLSFM